MSLRFLSSAEPSHGFPGEGQGSDQRNGVLSLPQADHLHPWNLRAPQRLVLCLKDRVRAAGSRCPLKLRSRLRDLWLSNLLFFHFTQAKPWAQEGSGPPTYLPVAKSQRTKDLRVDHSCASLRSHCPFPPREASSPPHPPPQGNPRLRALTLPNTSSSLDSA